MTEHYGSPLLLYEMWWQAARPISSNVSEWSKGSFVSGNSSTIQIKTIPSSEILVIQLQGCKALHPIIPSWSTSWEHRVSHYNSHYAFLYSPLTSSPWYQVFVSASCLHTHARTQTHGVLPVTWQTKFCIKRKVTTAFVDNNL